MAMSVDDLRKYACEFIGTFVLVFFAAGAVMVGALTGQLGSIGSGLISGLVICIVIYSFGQISGAHVNPALSIAATALGKLEMRLLPGYIVVQMAGSAAGALLLLACVGQVADMGANLPNEALGVSPGVALVIELILSFVLMWVICGTAFHEGANVAFAGLAIGATVGIEVMLMGNYAGAAMNPARAFGPYLVHGDLTHYWIYVIGPVAGMLAGAMIYRFTHAGTTESSKRHQIAKPEAIQTGPTAAKHTEAAQQERELI